MTMGTEHPNVQRIREALAAYNAGDPKGHAVVPLARYPLARER
jgi:hypothetical protein